MSKHRSPWRGPGWTSPASAFRVSLCLHFPRGWKQGLVENAVPCIGFFPQTVLSCWSVQETASGPTSPALGVLPCFTGTDTQSKGVYFAASKEGKHFREQLISCQRSCTDKKRHDNSNSWCFS